MTQCEAISSIFRECIIIGKGAKVLPGQLVSGANSCYKQPFADVLQNRCS